MTRTKTMRPLKLDSFLARAETLSPDRESNASRPVMRKLKELESGERQAVEKSLTLPTLEPGEQYRFHFDMTRCIGCRCCEVACNEQNGNPAEINWRRVGEVEGGTFPHVKRFHVSMACNHCLEPACLEGCPAEAYEKLENGIVKHHADRCIGCQYCTWNCPYGVPQYNPERSIVTKCHMCVGRIDNGQLPACVEACPVQAIEIEKVKPAEWREAIAEANAPGVPPADLTLSTTRITLPADLPEDFGKRSVTRLTPEPAHHSLVYFLTLSQASVGAVLAAWFLTRGPVPTAGYWLTLAAAVLGHASLAGATLHLGKPARAYRAMFGMRRSWLSREVAAFSAYAAAVAGLGGLCGLRLFAPGLVNFSDRVLDGAFAASVLTGALGIYCSVRIYRIPARPAWDSLRTNLGFFLTAAVLGCAAAIVTCRIAGLGVPLAPLLFGLAASALASAVVPWMLPLEAAAKNAESSVRGAASILSQFSRTLWIRSLLLTGLAVGAVAAALAPERLSPLNGIAALLCTFAAEWIGRVLFFRCVVPRNMPQAFFSERPQH